MLGYFSESCLELTRFLYVFGLRDGSAPEARKKMRDRAESELGPRVHCEMFDFNGNYRPDLGSEIARWLQRCGVKEREIKSAINTLGKELENALRKDQK